MKKVLMTWNVVLYFVLYSISLLYVGFYFGVRHQNPYGPALEFFLFPVVYLLLLILGGYLLKNQQYCSGKSCCLMASVTLVFISSIWGLWLANRFQDLHEEAADIIYLDIILYPGVLFFFSVVISIIYLICAARIRIENRD